MHDIKSSFICLFTSFVYSFRCLSFHMEHRDVVGNVMVAHRNVEAGEVVLEETPAVLGPCNKAGRLNNVCVECLSTKAKERCEKCGFPVCDKECEYKKKNQNMCV
jgi:hypothetical protein